MLWFVGEGSVCVCVCVCVCLYMHETFKTNCLLLGGAVGGGRRGGMYSFLMSAVTN